MQYKMQNSIPCHGQETPEENTTSVKKAGNSYIM